MFSTVLKTKNMFCFSFSFCACVLFDVLCFWWFVWRVWYFLMLGDGFGIGAITSKPLKVRSFEQGTCSRPRLFFGFGCFFCRILGGGVFLGRFFLSWWCLFFLGLT